MNDLQIINNIQAQLETPRQAKDNVFPLSPTHRKELRELRNKNIGNLRNQLLTIKQLKKEEYEKKHSKEIIGTFKQLKLKCTILNEDWQERVDHVNLILTQRKELEKKVDLKNCNIASDHGAISNLETSVFRRFMSIDEGKQLKTIVSADFEEKYGLPFKKVDEIIDQLITQYEEAINFGDLELVKKLYYLMKKSEKLFNEISNLKV